MRPYLPNSTKQTKHKNSFQGNKESPVDNDNPSKTNKLTALVWFAVFMVGLFLAYTCTKIAIGVGAFTALPTVYEVGNGVAVFDRNNHHISTVYADRDSIPVPFSKMSINIKRAALAAEDHHFYEQHG